MDLDLEMGWLVEESLDKIICKLITWLIFVLICLLVICYVVICCECSE